MEAGWSNGVAEEEKTFLDQFDDMVSLSRGQRLIGFAVTFILGWLISIMSLFALPQIVLHPEKFALLYTAGNILSLCSTGFLWGPWAQLRDMCRPVRLPATVLYIASMIFTLFAAFKWQLFFPTLMAIIVQFCAMAWYCASYIPYGHELIKSCMTRCCSSICAITG